MSWHEISALARDRWLLHVLSTQVTQRPAMKGNPPCRMMYEILAFLCIPWGTERISTYNCDVFEVPELYEVIF